MAAERVEGAEAVAVQLSEEEALPILRDGEVVGGQQIPWSSNYTFLLRIDAGPGRFLRAVYKPKAGERPLYDFPGGTLYKREYAAYLLGRAIGWPPVPLTLIREGPYGVGSMQLYVESDPRITYFDLVSEHTDEFSRFAAFDLVANNADRKGGHCVLGANGTIWSIDHGLTFHSDFKVRTVMLEFWGAPLLEELLPDLQALADRLSSSDGLRGELCELLSAEEVDTLLRRTEAVLDEPVFPRLDPRRNVPWPLE